MKLVESIAIRADTGKGWSLIGDVRACPRFVGTPGMGANGGRAGGC